MDVIDQKNNLTSGGSEDETVEGHDDFSSVQVILSVQCSSRCLKVSHRPLVIKIIMLKLQQPLTLFIFKKKGSMSFLIV